MSSSDKYDLTAELKANLTAWTADKARGIRQSVDKNTELMEQDLKKNSPRRKKGKRSKRLRGGKYKPGSYARSWRIRVAKDSFSTYQKEVYNKEHYQLTHLLERGHVLRSGKRVAARVHIKPAEESAEKNFVKDIEKILKG